MAILCAALISCNKNTVDAPPKGDDGTADHPKEYGEFELTEGAVFMTENMTSIFDSVEEGKIAISASAPAESVPSVGTVIICPITEKTPAGLLVKVKSIDKEASGYVLTTEPATLVEAFEELHVVSTVNISSFLQNIIDENGKAVDAESVSTSIWDEFANESYGSSSDTPTKASGISDLSIKIPIVADMFSGHVFLDFNMKVDIDISGHRLNRFNITLDKKTGIAGSVILETESEFKTTLVEREWIFRPFLIPGTPIVVKPSIKIEDTFEAKGKIEMKSNLKFLCENQTYTLNYNGGNPAYDSKKNTEDDSYIKFEYLNSDAEMELSATAEGKFAFYDDDLLALGVEATAKQNLHLKNEINMDNEGLLVQNPEIVVTPSLEAGIFCDSFLFGLVDLGEDSRIQYTWDFGLPSYTISSLPRFINIQNNKAGGSLNVSADVEEMSLLRCSEKGFALFEEGSDEPLIHLSFENGNNFAKTENKTKSVISDEVSFTLPDSKKKYFALSYAVADEKYYYDEIWVDLGLSVLWAKWNVGATSPEESGGYYAWGETEEKENYSMKYYQHAYFTGYYYENGEPIYSSKFIGLDIRNTKYDVAHVKWGNGARLPSEAEVDELASKCTYKLGYYNGVKGIYVTGPSGNSTFLPMAGRIYSDNVVEDYGADGRYWTGTDSTDSLGSPTFLAFDDEDPEPYSGSSSADLSNSGFSVRPVKDIVR